MLTFKWNWPCLNLSDKTLNMEEKLKIGKKPGINRIDFWIFEIYEFRHVDGKTGYIYLHESCRPMF